MERAEFVGETYNGHVLRAKAADRFVATGIAKVVD